MYDDIPTSPYPQPPSQLAAKTNPIEMIARQLENSSERINMLAMRVGSLADGIAGPANVDAVPEVGFAGQRDVGPPTLADFALQVQRSISRLERQVDRLTS